MTHRTRRILPFKLFAGLALVLVGLAADFGSFAVLYAPHHGRPEFLLLVTGALLLFTAGGVCLMMIGAAMIVSAVRPPGATASPRRRWPERTRRPALR